MLVKTTLIEAVNEYNEDGYLIYAGNYPGAYVRGKTKEEAVSKFPGEIGQYCRWLGISLTEEKLGVSIVQEKLSDLQICDADSDVLFDSETVPLTMIDYKRLRALAMKSAIDFEILYRSIPVKDEPLVLPRKTFYGMIPTTAREMYNHTKNVNNYYFGEICVPAENEPDIRSCRFQAFAALEKQPDFLANTVFTGNYNEQWSLRKVCRRFVWHDRIHAKAMYRAAIRLWGEENIENPFCFILST